MLRLRHPQIRIALLVVGAVSLLWLLQRNDVGQRLTLYSGVVLQWAQQPAIWIEQTQLWLRQRKDLQQQNQRLQRRLAELAPLLQQMRTLQEENRQLRQLLHVRNIQGYRWQAVQVVGYSPDRKSRHLLLRAPTAQVDDVVVSSEGLVGLVDGQAQGHVVVRTILDASLAVPLTKENSNLAALARGNGTHLQIDFVPANSRLHAGDLLRTSGAGGIYPPGLPVARVTSIEPRRGSPFLRVHATPVAQWQQKRWLAVVHQP